VIVSALWITRNGLGPASGSVLKDDPVTPTEAITRLRAAGCVFAEEEAAVLAEAAAAAAGAAGHVQESSQDHDTLATLVERRAAGEPLEQVVGYADFCGVRVHLRPGVFVPRVRSELLVRVAAQHATGTATVVDLCCGSGALGLAVLRRVPGVALHSADLDPVAVATARDNLTTPVYQGDLFAALPPALQGRIDVLVANVPYVATGHLPLLPAEARDHEPRSALDGGADGLDVFRRVAADALIWLAPGGVLLSEVTDAQLAPAAEAVYLGGLDADSIYDDDLEARVIRGRRTR
jgi:release factor glutamine methyltransferase